MTTMSHIETGVSAGLPPASNRAGRIAPAVRPESGTRVVVTWDAVINYFVPIGYEDEGGFHYGERPMSSERATEQLAAHSFGRFKQHTL
jgi:hypothetical protein